MKLKDFIKENICVDVCDTYDERCYIAFVGPVKLTAAGKNHFRGALDLNVEPAGAYDITATIETDTEEQAEDAKEFFFSAGGFCSSDDYDKWFEEV